MKQIEKIKVQTPIFVKILFLIALLPWIILFCYFTGKASASTVRDNRTLDSYCERQFEQSMRYKISPLAYKKCQSRFDIKTNEWMTWNYTK